VGGPQRHLPQHLPQQGKCRRRWRSNTGICAADDAASSLLPPDRCVRQAAAAKSLYHILQSGKAGSGVVKRRQAGVACRGVSWRKASGAAPAGQRIGWRTVGRRQKRSTSAAATKRRRLAGASKPFFVINNGTPLGLP